MNSAGRKITVVVLMIVSIAFIVGSIFLATQLQQSQAPDDTGAAGFGEGAIRTNFDAVGQTFRTTPCEVFLNKGQLENSGIASLVDLSISFSSSEQNSFEQGKSLQAVNCRYEFNDRLIVFRLYSYAEGSFIDDSPEALYGRINPQTLRLPEYGGDIIGDMIYFYSYDIEEPALCQSNLYHRQNDFEYAQITYGGFGDCSNLDMVQLNEELSSFIGLKLSQLMEPFLLDIVPGLDD